jgi:sarcosine oxidase
MRVIVIGLGCVGSAVAATLAKRGIDVVGLEQFEIGHEKGSSAHQSRAFRMAYAEHEGYVPLLKRSRKLWMELNKDAQDQIFFETGGLYISNKTSGLVQDSIASADAHDVPYEMLDVEALRVRYPIFQVPDDTIAMVEPLAGMIVPERAIAAYIEIAMKHGADLREQCKVLSWKESQTEVVVETDQGTMKGDKLVICKGAWTSEISIRASRQVLTWWENDIDTTGLPIWSIEMGGDVWLYGFPSMSSIPGPAGFKVAKHFPEETIDPDDDVAKEVRADDEETVRSYVEEWLPEVAGSCTTMHTCMYGNSDDGHFRIGLLHDHKRTCVIAGLSGHGFKFQPVLGEIGADLAMKGRTEFDISFLGL